MKIIHAPLAPVVRPVVPGEVQVRWNADPEADWFYVKTYEKAKGQPPRFRDDLSETVHGTTVKLSVAAGSMFCFTVTAHDSTGARADSPESSRSAFMLG